jgi:hypothetical protein
MEHYIQTNYTMTFHVTTKLILLIGRAIAHAVSRRPFTAEARIRFRISQCEVYGE